MNRNFIIAILAIAAAGTAAAESYADYNPAFVPAAARAAVQADAAQARRGVNPSATSYNPLAQFRSTQSRDEVRAEFLAQRDAVAAFTSEDSGSAYLAGGVRTTRATRVAGNPVKAQ